MVTRRLPLDTDPRDLADYTTPRGRPALCESLSHRRGGGLKGALGGGPGDQVENVAITRLRAQAGPPSGPNGLLDPSDPGGSPPPPVTRRCSWSGRTRLYTPAPRRGRNAAARLL